MRRVDALSVDGAPQVRVMPVAGVPVAVPPARREGRSGERPAVLRSYSFRVGIGSWLLFTVILLATGFLFYNDVQGRILAHIDGSIAERLDHLTRVYGTGGLDAVKAAIAEHRQEYESRPMDDATGIRLVDASGALVAGNVRIDAIDAGRTTLRGADLGFGTDSGRYRFVTVPLGEGMLSIGRGLDALDELRTVALRCLLRSLVIVVLLGIVSALWLARRTHRRMEGWSVAIERVRAGDLEARLPLSDARDDIDDMSARINSLIERLAQTVEGLRQVSTDIAHDLKTPLNRLYMDLEEAAQRGREGLCTGDELDRALDEARAINNTFEALLSIAQIEAGARRARFRSFALTGLLEDVVEVYAPVVEERGLTLELRTEGDDPLLLLGDRALIMQQVVNLIENALRHGARAGTTIVLEAGRHAGGVRFVVGDRGPGIPEAERERVFRRLYRLERSRTTPGTGLGLSPVKAIADLHCGRIELLDNRPGLSVVVTFGPGCPDG